MTISISKQAYRTKGALTVQPPKTDNSMRKIALSPETMELLKQEQAASTMGNLLKQAL